MHDAPKKTITLSGFREALQARKLAELKSKAKAQARAEAEVEEQANGHVSQQDAEQTKALATEGLEDVVAAAPMEVDSDLAPESAGPSLELVQQAAKEAARQSRKEEWERRQACIIYYRACSFALCP